MKTKTKALALALCAVLLVVSTVFVTMAYLTSKTDVVTNTFTVGKVTITLDEADVKSDGTYESDVNARVDANTYKLIPGHTYIKDPTIHVADDSEECWLFVKVENGLKDIIAGNTSVSENDSTDTVYTIEAQMTKNGWYLVDDETNIYAYEDIATAEIKDYKVFDDFKLKGSADVSLYENAKIVVTAYAIQADGFASATEAWTIAGGEAQNK